MYASAGRKEDIKDVSREGEDMHWYAAFAEPIKQRSSPVIAAGYRLIYIYIYIYVCVCIYLNSLLHYRHVLTCK